MDPTRKKNLEKVAALAHKRLDDAGGSGVIALATGCGKTKIAIDYISKDPGRTLWVVPTTQLRDVDMPAEWDKWGKSSYYDEHVNGICYASLPKLSGFHYKWVVLDEGHNMTHLKQEFFENNQVDNVLVLSATVPHEPEKREILYDYLNLKTVIRLSPDSAAKLKLISDFKIVCLGCKLAQEQDNPERARYNYWERKIKDMKDAGIKIGRKTFLGRMHAIHKATSKIKKAKEFSTSREHGRLLIFSSRQQYARYLSPNYYYASSGDQHLEAFRKGDVDTLSVVNALNEGVNIPQVDTAIITQVNSNSRHFIQRLGRTIRYRDGHESVVYIFYYMDTQDEEWVRKNLETFDKSKITWKTYEDEKRDYLLSGQVL